MIRLRLFPGLGSALAAFWPGEAPGPLWQITAGDGAATVIRAPGVAVPVITAGDGTATVQE